MGEVRISKDGDTGLSQSLLVLSKSELPRLIATREVINKTYKIKIYLNELFPATFITL